MPARALPLGIAGDVDVGFDDAARLLEPEPHMPVNPDVSGIPEDVDNPDVAEIAVDVDIPNGIDGVVADDAMPPGIGAMEAVVVPIAVANPPPS
jgi:hypothetical protein